MPKFCPQCRNETSDEAGFCGNCGAAIPAAVPSVPQSAKPAAPSPSGTTPIPSYAFNAARWSNSDRITGVASLVLLVALFLPWFSFGAGGFSVTISGISEHGYLCLVLFMVIAILAYLGARAGWEKLPIKASIAHAPVMLVASLFNLVIVLIAFLLKPGGGVGWTFGAFLALIAAAVAAAPLAIPAIQSRR